MALEIGKKAPTFKLLNSENQEIALKDFAGKKVVLYFYPRAMTPGCTVQACGLRDIKKELAKHNAIVLGISPDAPLKLKKFIEKEKLNFDLLSDVDHEVASKYGVWGKKKFMGKEVIGIIRTTFVIDEQGKVQYISPKVNTKTHHEDILEILNTL